MPREVPYSIWFGKNTDGNVTALTSTTAAKWEDVYKFRCPENMQVILKAGDIISAYLEATAAQIAAPDAQVRIEVRDASEEKRERVFGPENYLAIIEFQDMSSRAKLKLEHPVLVRPRDYIVIMVKDDTAMDATDISTTNYGVLETTKII